MTDNKERETSTRMNVAAQDACGDVTIHVPQSPVLRLLSNADLADPSGKVLHGNGRELEVSTLEGFPEGASGVSASKLLSLIGAELYAMNGWHRTSERRTVTIPLVGWMRLIGEDTASKQVRDAARRRLEKAIGVLECTRLSWTDRKTGKRISTGNGIVKAKGKDGKRDGTFIIMVSKAYADELLGGYVTRLIPEGFAIPARQAVAYSALMAMEEHYFMRSNIANGTNGIQSVRSLVESNAFLPSIGEVKDVDGRFRDRIVLPFSKGLRYLQDAGIAECGFKGPMGTFDLDGVPMDFRTFIGLTLAFGLCRDKRPG